MTEKASKKLGLNLNEPDQILSGADGNKLNVLGVAKVTIKSTFRDVDTSVYVLKGSRRNLLGMPEIKKLNLLAVVNAMCTTEFDPLKMFPKVFDGLGTMPGIFSIELNNNTEPVRLFAPRPIAAGLREKAKEEIDKMLASNVIEPIEKPTDWCSGLTIAPKQGGKNRMCVDLTNLNKCVKREVYPLPRISDMLSKLSEGVMFSKLDANSGFWQVRLDEKCKELTTFVTPWGRFCFNRMPFGISSAPEFFQREMEKILKGLEGIICLMDDILVYGKTVAEHWNRLHRVLRRIEKSGMTLREEKCEFGCEEVKFLGHIVSGSGIKPDPGKIKAIVEMLPPKSKKEVRRFTGMVNYLMKFNKKLASLCVPIYHVSGSKSEFFWGPDQQEAFENVKKEISNSPVLCSFDINKKHRVSADSSKNALGAVLLQYNNEGNWQPVEYASRKMTETETRYAMVEKEALATTWACEKFDYYLVGRKFEIETDHKPLIAILGEKDLSKLPARVQRFKLRLMRYDYDIFHTPGKDMFLADLLSRPSSNNVCDEVSKLNCNKTEAFVNSIVSFSIYEDIKEEKLRVEVSKDSDALQCIEFLNSEWPSDLSILSKELLGLHGSRERLSIYNNMLLYESRLYIPKSLRLQYLEICHEGHQGITKCRRRAQRHFWWPGYSKDISDFVNKCNVCIMHTQVKHQPMQEAELPSKPWEVIGSDIFVFEDDLYLLVIDYYSKWIEAVRIETQTSKQVISKLKSLFSCFGIPRVIRSDNGSCYVSKEFYKFGEKMGFALVTSSPRYPCSNGLAESAVKTIKRLWKKCDDKDVALSAYRTTPLSSGYSPSDLIFGRAIRSNLGFPYESDVDYDQFEEKEIRYRKKIKRNWDKKYRVSKLDDLVPGQIVYVKAPTDLGDKGIVLRKDSTPDSYWIRVGLSEIRRNRKHLFLLYSAEKQPIGNSENESCGPSDYKASVEDNSELDDQSVGENNSESDESINENISEPDVEPQLIENEVENLDIELPKEDPGDKTPDNENIVEGETPNQDIRNKDVENDVNDVFDEVVEDVVPRNKNRVSSSRISFVPVDKKNVVTRSGRNVKTRQNKDMVYYQ